MGEGKSERINDKRVDDCINGGACAPVYLGGRHYREKREAGLPRDRDTDSIAAMMFGI